MRQRIFLSTTRKVDVERAKGDGDADREGQGRALRRFLQMEELAQKGAEGSHESYWLLNAVIESAGSS